MFTCLNDLITVQNDKPEFLNAMMVLTDYFKTYGEQLFNIVSRERRQAIENHHEVIVPKS